MAKTIAILAARLIFGAMFLMATSFKFMDMGATAGYIAAAGFPFPLFLAWVAAFFEVGLAVAFLTGAFFSEAALLAGVYVIFLAFAFHGPNRWEGNQAEFGFFVDHFTFLAGLLFAFAHGPGEKLSVKMGLLRQPA
ncbi:DoxX family protein [Rhizobium sp. BG4]|uniref:DoxX family protein n=1 Tax=Rhizobium sp. BG4 TaxID=2613770 RepID=UPI00193EAB7E|nr:DoxX family protein [Rhizobium sp. BG4]QRM42346.1 DoxX family protein [Rhizobium sp. BG4]